MNLQSLLSLGENKKILILGLGKENLQFLGWLKNIAQFPFEKVLVADQASPKNLEFEILQANCYFGEKYLEVLKNPAVELVFKSPGIWSLIPEISEFRNRKGLDSVNSSLVFFFEKFREQIIAVTGTKGKSTTSSLLNNFLNNTKIGLKSFYCGNTTNISPYTYWTELDQDVDRNTYFVVEASSFQLQDLGFAGISPKYSVITNYYIDHLDQHSNKMEYWLAKDNIYKYQKPGDMLVATEQILSVRPGILLDETKGYKLLVDTTTANKISKLLDSKLRGAHNALNLALAVVVSECVIEKTLDFGLVSDKIKQESGNLKLVLNKFQPLSHRLEQIRRHTFEFSFESKITSVAVNFYDDGYATEPDAVVAAIEALTEQKNNFLWLVVAGKDKKGNLSKLAKAVLQAQLQNQLYKVNYTGEVGKNLLIGVYDELGVQLPVGTDTFKDTVAEEFQNLDELERQVSNFFDERWQNYVNIGQSQKAEAEQLFSQLELNIVFSPAGSSYDEFVNSVERAEWWTKHIVNLR